MVLYEAAAQKPVWASTWSTGLPVRTISATASVDEKPLATPFAFISYCLFCPQKAAWCAGKILPVSSDIPLCINPYTALWLQVEDNRNYRLHKLTVQERAATSPYINTRTVFLKRILKQGRYILIPTTYHPGITTKFILRLFTDVPSKLRWVTLTTTRDLPLPTLAAPHWKWLLGGPQISLTH